MIKPEEVYRIGRLGKPHGVKGEISFMFDDDDFDRVDADYLVVCVEGILIPFFIEEYRFRSSETALMKFDGIDSQEQARELTNCEVFFPYALTDSDDGGMTMAQIVGFSIVDSHQAVGTITSVDDSTENILFEVLTADNRTILIPAVPEFIKDIDEEKRTINMDLPGGLLDL